MSSAAGVRAPTTTPGPTAPRAPATPYDGLFAPHVEVAVARPAGPTPHGRGAALAADHALGRALAARALVALGAGSSTVGRAPDRSPVWPRGVVGSITHCAGFAAAAVAHRAAVAALGVDAEPARPLPPHVAARLPAAELDPAVRAAVAAGVDPDLVGTLLWCGREAAYKAWYPRSRRVLGLLDLRVVLDPVGAGSVEVVTGEPVPPWAAGGLALRWAVRDGLVLAGVTVAASAAVGTATS